MISNLAILMTCHNRMTTTIACLQRLFAAVVRLDACECKVFLVDDGSTDGTAEAVRKSFPQVRVIGGDGTLYWARGMELAWKSAVSEADWDAYLWLNDDVRLRDDALLRLFDAFEKSRCGIIVGSLQDELTGRRVYGTMSDGLFAGSVVFVSREVFSKIGMISGEYRHAWADCDYAMRCRKCGVKWIDVDAVGDCGWHELRPSLRNRSVRERLALMGDPKGWCIADLWTFRKRNWGIMRAIASSSHLVLHLLFSEWGWWHPIYWAMCKFRQRGVRQWFWRILHRCGVAKLMNDEGFFKLQLLGVTGERYALPKDGGGVNSLVLWQRLNWRMDVQRFCSDKYEVRKFVRHRNCEAILNPLCPDEESVWETGDDIPFELLPDKFVLKCTVGSHMNLIVHDKSELDVAATRRLVNEWMHTDYSKVSRERQYAHVKPRVICEALIQTEAGGAPDDYKIMCANGRVLYWWVDEDRFGEHRRSFYSAAGKPLEEVMIGYCDYPRGINPRPENWRQMMYFASKLSAGIPIVRVDLYNVNGQILFGEMTFTSGGGCETIKPERYSRKMAQKAYLACADDVAWGER